MTTTRTGPGPTAPLHRPRRLRQGPLVREMVADVDLALHNVMLPLFVRAGHGMDRPVSSMPGVSQMSPDVALEAVRRHLEQGIRQFMLFGVIDAEEKDPLGSAAQDPDNPVNETVHRIRDAGLEALVAADLCFCEYTSHGHCGVLHPDPRITVDNDATLPLLGSQAVVLARSGVDLVAPSGMMDGMVRAIRSALDEAGQSQVGILSYTVKYASSFYEPFREAGEGAPQHGDRKGYQMDYRRRREWETELAGDEAQGADMVMVKPAGPYLDIIRGVRERTALPVAAYQVSGEYSMIHAAARAGIADLRSAALESLYAIRRAGADLVLTYFAPRLPDWLGR